MRAKTLGSWRDEVDVQRDGTAGFDGRGKGYGHDGTVISIVVVGVDVADGVEQVGAAFYLEALQVDPAPTAFGCAVAAELAAGLAHEAALLVLEGVEVEVELEFADGVG